MAELIIKNKLGQVLSDLNAWEKGFTAVDRKMHWREGYSAYSLAQFFINGKGQLWLEDLINSMFNSHFEYQYAIIEHASKLDNYRGKQRMQDLAIWGNVNEQETFVAVEAKVLEPFGNYSVRDEYELAILYQNKNHNSKKPDRVREVVNSLFSGLTPYDEPACNLRYQLLHYLKASILEGANYSESKKYLSKRRNPDIVILPILVFKTEHYKENLEAAQQNKKEYLAFCKALDFSVIKIGNETVFHKVINKTKVYMLYEEISL